ncbi:FAD/NAD(P)-binding domain-containing protein [Aspergillus heteromorphus CBS 117.55]|uniref:Cholesterol oxidase n=1 Tax=Aspergillus heteromorphus CBS 117.55 TaxID=1448321 RepID=A0A317WQ78_9EURO|nr:FAD/NAD(P)-binding domain-containing protein [Aspergillus heteromorphus CBS 117.55]PWY87442.1 FAD/NAD(P)-binding domain-containing protein [Aspergillus heteromorphus CBS 117.55]
MANFRTVRPDEYPNLSRPFCLMQSQYDVVVVGSGYGAGVAASRMARAGKSVAVLELGWERRPGTFPESLSQTLRDFNVSGPSGGLLSGKPTRLFQLTLGDGQHAFRAHALGGCSLVNAGVFLEADKQTLQMSPWPSEIRQDSCSLERYYSRAADMLQPSVYPDNHPRLRKLDALQQQAEQFSKNHSFYRAPLTTFFDRSRNSVGVEMNENCGSGHESTGLNDGSKNSVATTYLADAWNWGAEIFCGCEVRYIEKVADGKGYIVYFLWHGNGRSVFAEEFKTQLFWVKANDLCFLGAGALGTTEILLRSKQYGLSMSPLVGRNVSGNGDMLILGYNGKEDINGVAGTNRPGPTITGVIDGRELSSRDALAGYVIQDGCIPKPLAPLIPFVVMMQRARDSASPAVPTRAWRYLKAITNLASGLTGASAARNALQRTSTYLVMSHDSNELTLTLESDMLFLRGPGEGRSEHFGKFRKVLGYVVNLAGAKMGFSYYHGRDQEEITVHPLGGANMSRDGTGREGVTNHLGQIYTGHGSEIYDGLVCCDASIVPTALGVNPLATISALAERSLDLLAKKHGYNIDMTTTNGDLDSSSVPRVLRQKQNISPAFEKSLASVGWQFSEVLEGHIGTQPNVDFEISELVGKSSSSAMRMFLTIEVCQRTDSSELQYTGICTGTVSCRALSRSTLRVLDGQVQFFVQPQDRADLTTMTYTLRLLSLEGTQYDLTGCKTVDSTAAFSIRKMWGSTTKVNVRITRDGGVEAAAGVLRISRPSFQRQIRTFRPTRPFNFRALPALIIFLAYFAIQLCLFFFRPLVPTRAPRRSLNAIKPKRPASASFNLRTKDGIEVLLEEYEPSCMVNGDYMRQGTTPQPVLCIPGVTGRANHSLFALPFLRCNIVEYFTKRGFRCYVLSPRWGCEPKIAENSTVFDVRLDIAAAVEHISSLENRKPYVVAHCQGSVALSMGLLDGTIDGTKILGITSSAVFMHQVFAYWNSVKAMSPVLVWAYEFLAGKSFPIGNPNRNGVIQKVLDVLIRFYPVAHRRDLCTSTTCRRTTFAFGLCWNHDNLDAAIHDNVGEFFEGTHTKLLEHITYMGRQGGCLDNELNPLITEKNLMNLKGLPMLFVSRTVSEVFKPESTLRDYEMLRRRFGEHLYRRFLVEGYGHLDPIIGKRAAEDVYWRVFEHAKWCMEQMDDVAKN